MNIIILSCLFKNKDLLNYVLKENLLNVNLKNNYNKTALDYAYQNNYIKNIKLLLLDLRIYFNTINKKILNFNIMNFFKSTMKEKEKLFILFLFLNNKNNIIIKDYYDKILVLY